MSTDHPTAIIAAEKPERTLSGWTLALWCAVAAFGTYFCMYTFRKPFTAALYEGESWRGVGLKTVFVIAQVLGYTVSKFLGIKIVSEMDRKRRAVALLGMVGFSEIALLLFALIPPPWNLVCLFLNGLPLGMVFGMVLGFLEGRRQTEALTAGLCCSFILADGVAKSVGAWLLKSGVPQYWMPVTAGLLFAPALLIFVWMLTRISPPSAADVAARARRSPMNRAERREFFCKYAVGLVLLGIVYLLVTVLRTLRADFAPEIWRGLGMPAQPDVYARSELIVALAVTFINGAVVFIRDNRRAFTAAMLIALAGVAISAAALLCLDNGMLSPFAYMVLSGLGLYLPYIAVHTTIFERLIAMTRDRGNIGYLMYLVDAYGYLGYVGVMVGHLVFAPSGDFLPFFKAASWLTAVASIVLLVPCWRYFSIIGARNASAACGTDANPKLTSPNI